MVFLALFTVVCGFEWFSLLVGTASPVYTGPALPGRKVPEFTAVLADGTPFTDNDLAQGQSTIVLFFRGRW
jgi:cytochrome oxidase Cu insertion factor (SCO1/SenC/PrrC family)